MLKILYAGCLGLSPAILSQFSVEMSRRKKTQKKNHQNPLFRGFKVIQGHRRWHHYKACYYCLLW